MTEPVFEITKAATFDAAHYLPDGPGATAATGACTATRSGWRRRCAARAQGRPAGWPTSATLERGAEGRRPRELDHGLLNEKPGLESPTLEHLCL